MVWRCTLGTTFDRLRRLSKWLVKWLIKSLVFSDGVRTSRRSSALPKSFFEHESFSIRPFSAGHVSLIFVIVDLDTVGAIPCWKAWI